jgi:periplasmic divalent cation tolerance protein
MARKTARSRPLVVLVTAASRKEAVRIGRALVGAKLAACANVLPAIRSMFRWKGKICDARETLLVIKSRADLFGALAREVKRLHSYEVPEIIALPIVDGTSDYLSWIRNSTRKPL